MSNCKNCGAPYTGETRCQWCGTVHGDAEEALLKREIEAAESRIEQLKTMAIGSYLMSQPFGGLHRLEPVYSTCCTLQEVRDRVLANVDGNWMRTTRF